jgi:hypothetical protein
MQRSDIKILLPFLVFYTLLTLLVLHNPFFWDTIQLGSKQAHWFYENDFKFLMLPEVIDSGHPPIFGMYLALIWKIFGKSLPISHLAILPFLLGIVIQVYFLLKKYIEQKFLILAMMLLLADPTLLAQSIIISPDIVLLFLFLLSLNAIHSQNRILLTAALIGLGMISMRGMMHVMVIFILDIILNIVFNRKYKLKNFAVIALSYIPAGIIAGTWLLVHYLKTGWIGYHENSPWIQCFLPVDLKGFIKNIFLLGWRLADFGRVFIWLAALPVLYLSLKRKSIDSNTKKLSLFFIIPFIVITPNLLLHSNLLGHRYLLVLYLSFALVFLYHVQKTIPQHFKKISLFLLAGLITGNLWVYGDKISKGWDSTLAHYPYYQLRKEMIAFIEKEHINKDIIGTAFPNNISTKYIDLSDEGWCFANKDFENNSYIFYSNVFNDFTDEELSELKTWHIVKELNSPTVKIILYKKP